MSVSSVCGHIQTVEVGSPGGGVGREKLYTALCQNGGIVVMELTPLLAGAHEPMSILKAGRQTHGLLLLALETLTSSLNRHLTGHNLFISGANANFVLVYKVQCHNNMCTCAC